MNEYNEEIIKRLPTKLLEDELIKRQGSADLRVRLDAFSDLKQKVEDIDKRLKTLEENK
jgi:hypothetical protein